LKILNGIFNLSPKEIEILAAFIDNYNKHKNTGLADSPFATSIKKAVAKQLEMENFNTLNPYILSLKNKRAIVKVEKGYHVHPILMPQGESEIVFTLL